MIEGKKYIVTRHFAGDKDLDTVIREIAVNRAYKDNLMFNQGIAKFIAVWYNACNEFGCFDSKE